MIRYLYPARTCNGKLANVNRSINWEYSNIENYSMLVEQLEETACDGPPL